LIYSFKRDPRALERARAYGYGYGLGKIPLKDETNALFSLACSRCLENGTFITETGHLPEKALPMILLPSHLYSPRSKVLFSVLEVSLFFECLTQGLRAEMNPA
jgi:hypothetical protein